MFIFVRLLSLPDLQEINNVNAANYDIVSFATAVRILLLKYYWVVHTRN